MSSSWSIDLSSRICAMDYPREKLDIQVLDDSTDETVEVAREVVERYRALGHDIVYIHRTDRTGYKAGALDNGLKTAKGEFIAIFDADFTPPEDWLMKVIHHFADPKIGMVQTRWTHLNRNYSFLTEVEAILLDGHFVLEHGGRSRAACFSTSTARQECGDCMPSKTPAGGNTTLSPRTPISVIVRNCRVAVPISAGRRVSR